MSDYTPGAIIERYMQLRAHKASLEAKIKDVDGAMEAMTDALHGMMIDQDVKQFKSEFGTAYQTPYLSAKMADRALVINHALQSGNWDIFTNHISKDYVRAFMDKNANRPPPGVEITEFIKVQIRKS